MAVNGHNPKRFRCPEGRGCCWCFPQGGKYGGNRQGRLTPADRRRLESVRSQLREARGDDEQ